MSVRPITVGEEQKAFGYPFVNVFAVFGGLQGVLMFMHRQRVAFKSNWFAHPGSFPRFAVLGAGGFLVGGLVGMAVFTDWELIRLYYLHREDKLNLIEGQKVPTQAF